jgi:hypothetical protein
MLSSGHKNIQSCGMDNFFEVNFGNEKGICILENVRERKAGAKTETKLD